MKNYSLNESLSFDQLIPQLDIIVFGCNSEDTSLAYSFHLPIGHAIVSYSNEDIL